jgi:hypothetical protein
MEKEDVMRINDAKRRSFNNGWKAAIKKAEEWLNSRKASENIIEQFKQFMKE